MYGVGCRTDEVSSCVPQSEEEVLGGRTHVLVRLALHVHQDHTNILGWSDMTHAWLEAGDPITDRTSLRRPVYPTQPPQANRNT